MEHKQVAFLLSDGTVRCGGLRVGDGNVHIQETFFDLVSTLSVHVSTIDKCRRSRSLAPNQVSFRVDPGAAPFLSFLSKRKVTFMFPSERDCREFVSDIHHEIERHRQKEGNPNALLESMNESTILKAAAVPMVLKVDLRKKNLCAQGMKLDDFEKVAGLALHRMYQPNEVVMEKGKGFEEICEVGIGSVVIENPNGGVASVVEVGESFGHLQLVIGGHITHTLRAGEGGCLLKCWNYEALRSLFQRFPKCGAAFYGQTASLVRSRLVSITTVRRDTETMERNSKEVGLDQEDERKKNNGLRELIFAASQQPSPSAGKSSINQIEGKENSLKRSELKESRSGGISKKDKGEEALYPPFRCDMKRNGGTAQRGHVEIFRSHFMFTSKVFGSKKKTDVPYSLMMSGAATMDLVEVKKKKCISYTYQKTSLLFSSKEIQAIYDSIQACSSANGIGQSSREFKEDFESENSDLAAADWERILAGSSNKKFGKDAICLNEGAEQKSLYQLVRGSVRVVKNGNVVTNLQEGAIFGEMSFISWFVEGASAVASADVIANDKVEMICLDDHMLSSLLTADSALASRFFSYLIRLLSSRADSTLTVGMEWMKIWCKETTVVGRRRRNQDLAAWLRKDLRFPDDTVTQYLDLFRQNSVTNVDSLVGVSNEELEKMGVPLLHRRKIQWILKDETTDGNNMRVADWLRREMRWPPDVLETYQKTFEAYERVTDLQKLTLEELTNMGIPLLHRRKIAHWMAVNH